MAGGYFTDVVLHSSKHYHQEDATELRLLSTDVATARGAVISRFHGVVRCGISVNGSFNLWVWRASLCVCASPRVRTLIRVRNSSLDQDGGEVVVMCVIGFAREVASRVS